MKKFICLILLLTSIQSFAQFDYFENSVNFEDTSHFLRIEIDTISNPNNTWHIREPSKNVFQSANSLNFAILTDSIAPYPINDTSSFIFKHVMQDMFEDDQSQVTTFQGLYKTDTDTLNDHCSVSFSPDNGSTWHDLLADTAWMIDRWITRPVFSGHQYEWTRFKFHLDSYIMRDMFNVRILDTIQFRFTFISDSVHQPGDGVMFDDFILQDDIWGIDEVQNNFLSKVFPNPTPNKVTIEFENPYKDECFVSLVNANGRMIISRLETTQSAIELDLNDLPSGNYHYHILNSASKQMSSGIIVKPQL